MKKLILYGDSNTYGYDPRDFFGGRYPEDVRWATVVAKALGDRYVVVEDGQNGRCLPSVTYGYFSNMVQEMEAGDVLVMMLGTNDILLTARPDVSATLQRLEQILSYVQSNCAGEMILIAPPYISDAYPDLQPYHDCSVELNARYLELAKTYDVTAWDTATWNIEMGSDGVHFTEAGHLRFAEKFLENMR